LHLIATALAALIFAIDLSLPLGVAGGIPYIVVVLIGVWHPSPRFTLVVALAATGLTGLGYVLSPPAGVPWIVVTNRGLALFAIWTAAALVVYHKRAEVRTLVVGEQAKIANRTKSDLLANMSHELRTPLNAIVAFTHAIKEQAFGPLDHDHYARYINDIHTSGHYLLELVDDLLDISAIETGDLVLREDSLDVTEVIELSLRLIGPLAKAANVSLSNAEGPDLPRVHADERRIKQILLSLLSNAVNFTPRGGKVTVEAELDGEGSFNIAVADTGIGMTKEEISTAFRSFGQAEGAFVRTHAEGGLGLSLTNSLVKLHGGELRIESTEGVGTTVTVCLPKERVVAEQHLG
jgi:signal transduction histidine kinase